MKNKLASTRGGLLLKIAFIGLIVLFFALYLRDIDYSNFSNLQIDWGYLLLASLISLGFRYWGVVIWRYILIDLGAKTLPSFTVLSNVYAKAWMGRYIPGTVTWIAGKIFMASKLGISKTKLAVSSLLEGGMQIVATMAVSLLILGFDSRLDVISPDIKFALVLLGLLSLVTLLPPVFNRLLAIVYRLVRKGKTNAELKTNGRAVVRSFALYAIGTLIMGSSYYFLTASLTPSVTPDMYLYFVGIFSLSGALGMATPLVPSGLGVRDGAQLILLSLIFPKEVALAITVVSRLWSAVVDVLFYVIATAHHKITARH